MKLTHALERHASALHTLVTRCAEFCRSDHTGKSLRIRPGVTLVYVFRFDRVALKGATALNFTTKFMSGLSHSNRDRSAVPHLLLTMQRDLEWIRVSQ